ncbi:MAG: multiple sugar transport system permease protein [Thermomicrobiales bacterium]|nr:multiple sugar transport system permease protein [Thermomicrobiales bacterium]
MSIPIASKAQAESKGSWRRPSFAGRRRRDGWLMMLPAVLIILALSIYPLIYSLRLAFYNWNLQPPQKSFHGLQNFRDALSDDRVWGALQNTLLIVLVGIALEFVIGLGLALLLVDAVRLRRFVLPIFMLPVMMVPIVVGLTWRMLWDNQYGAINSILRKLFDHDLGLSLFGSHWQLLDKEPINIVWLGQTNTAKIAMIVTQVWQWTPFMFLVLLAALSSVNPELYEAASLDGASWRQLLWDITLPGISHVIAVALLFRALDAFKIFDLVYMFTQGGPGNSTETISWYIYELGFKFFRMGYASAISYLVLILLSIAATVYVSAFLREEPT